MSNEQIENIEVSINEAKKYVDRMNSVLALTKNKDFTDVIEKGYFENEASRLVLLKADPSMQKAEDQEAILKSIDAIGYFRQYLRTTISMGRMMEKSMIEDQKTRQELMGEGDE
jgi:hypothetical protein